MTSIRKTMKKKFKKDFTSIKDNNDGTFTYTKVYDPEPILAQAREERSNQKGKYEKGRELEKFASIPTQLIESLIWEGRLTIELLRGDKDQKLKLMSIIKNEYPLLLSSTRKLI